MPSRVSWTGISSSVVTKCTAVCGERMTRATVSACVSTGPTLARPETSVADVEEAADPAGRRGVHHHGVVDVAAWPGLERRAASVAFPCAARRTGRARSWWRSRPGPAWSAPGRCAACRRTSPGSPAARPRGRRPARTGRRRVGRPWPSPMPTLRSAYGSGGSRTAARCPAAPRPRSAGPCGRRVASARARAAATVVLPVPPLPVTTCSRTPSQSVSLALITAWLSPSEAISRADTSWFGGGG